MKKILLTVMVLIVAGSFCACRTTRKQKAAKTPEVPVKETPAAKVETPAVKVETPAAKVEAPKAAAPAAKVEAPKAPAAKVEAPKAPAAKVETPAAKVEAPKAEPTILKAETPKAEAKTEFPAKYIVKTGDNLWKISSKFYGRGTAWKQIYEANKANIKRTDFLEPGTELVIPAPAK